LLGHSGIVIVIIVIEIIIVIGGGAIVVVSIRSVVRIVGRVIVGAIVFVVIIAKRRDRIGVVIIGVGLAVAAEQEGAHGPELRWA
jgi:hypothetical protein